MTSELNSLIWLASFFVFTVVQSIAINGIYECFSGTKVRNDLQKPGEPDQYQGMVFFMLAPKFFYENKNKAWAKPIWGCIKCMASFWGSLTYWPVVLVVFGFRPIEVIGAVFNAFMLVYLNFHFYKKQ